MVTTRSSIAGSREIIEGKIAGEDVLLCIGGMGKVNAAHAATLLITRHDPEALIVFGIGGAYTGSDAGICDIAVAKEEIAGDEGVLAVEGFKGTEYIGIPLVKTASSTLWNVYPSSPELLEKTMNRLKSFQHSGRVFEGSFVTLSTCTGTSARAKELEARYSGLCENMEGAAAAQVAAMHGTPWLELRGISNRVEDRDVKAWDIPGAASAVQNAVLHILEGWER
jgi:futalosine hydrolase